MRGINALNKVYISDNASSLPRFPLSHRHCPDHNCVIKGGNESVPGTVLRPHHGNLHAAVARGMAFPGLSYGIGAHGRGAGPAQPRWSMREGAGSEAKDRPLPFTSAWQICQQYPGHKSLSWHSGSVLSTLGGEGENPEGFRPGGIRGRLLSRKPVPGSPTVQGRRLRRLPCPGESPSGTCSGKGGEETWQK